MVNQETQQHYIQEANRTYLNLMDEIAKLENGKGNSLDEIAGNVNKILERMQVETVQGFYVIHQLAVLSTSLYIYNSRNSN